MTLRYSHTRLLVREYAACFRFYRDVRGFAPNFGDEASGYADFSTGDVTLALFDRQEMAEAVSTASRSGEDQDRVALIFAVENVDQAYSDLMAKGVTFIIQPTERTDWGIRVAHFRDPDGTLLE
ncbi:MAG TPA: VOC family protein, partial [Ktedonobacterales bacterium]|nr:VOC family protein [Ktedonobacterales bacterium]